MTRGALILVGSGEFTPAMDDLDRDVLTALAKPRARVAIVPTAWGPHPIRGPYPWGSRTPRKAGPPSGRPISPRSARRSSR
jgi:hypothetical protein